MLKLTSKFETGIAFPEFFSLCEGGACFVIQPKSGRLFKGFFQLIFWHVHPFSKVKKEKEHVVAIIKKKNGK